MLYIMYTSLLISIGTFIVAVGILNRDKDKWQFFLGITAMGCLGWFVSLATNYYSFGG